MGQSAKTCWTKNAMKSSGLIGLFQIDYKTQMIKGSGMTGPYFRILKNRMAEGVPLAELDSAYHPFDLGQVRRNEATYVGTGRRHSQRFRVYNHLSGGYDHVEAQFTVHVDQFGIPESAEGALYDVSGLVRDEEPNTYKDLLDIAGHLSEAKRLAKRNHMDFLWRDLHKVFKFAGEIAMNRVLE